MLRPQVLRRRHDTAPSVGARLAQLQMATQTGSLNNDELRRAVYELIGLPPTFGDAAPRTQRRAPRDLKQARAS